MYVNTTGIVLRETAYKDSSKILTILTADEGKLTVSARGALRRNSKLAAASQLLVFSEMTLLCSRDRWTMTEARSIEQFAGLRDSVGLLALGAYFVELTEAVADEDSPNRELLPLVLNALYALSEKIRTPEFVKAAFELRLMAISGFSPMLDGCAMCGAREPEESILNLEGGRIVCSNCNVADGAALGRGALHAARYILSCESKRLFSFKLSEQELHGLSAATEGYLLMQLDRNFRALDYYKVTAD